MAKDIPTNYYADQTVPPDPRLGGPLPDPPGAVIVPQSMGYSPDGRLVYDADAPTIDGLMER